MNALVKYAPGPGNVALREVAEPRCGRGQVKIEVAHCGVCGTDLHVLHDTFRNYPPVILGHEFSGTVVEVGEGVSHVAAGDPVTVLPASAVICGACPYCRTGDFMFCPERRGMGHGVNGAFARYAVVRQDQVYRLPPGLSLAEAALCEPFACVVQAVLELTEVRLGDVALVSGCGPVGLMCLKLLAAQGIHAIVAGVAEDRTRLEAARRMGAARALDVGEQDLQAVVRDATGGRGADVVFECSGAPASIASCLQAVRPLGAYTQVGICGREVSVNFDAILFKQLRLRGSVGYSARTWDRLLTILGQGTVRLADLVSHRLPLERWQEGFEICEKKRGLKVLISPTLPSP